MRVRQVWAKLLSSIEEYEVYTVGGSALTRDSYYRP